MKKISLLDRSAPDSAWTWTDRAIAGPVTPRSADRAVGSALRRMGLHVPSLRQQAAEMYAMGLAATAEEAIELCLNASDVLIEDGDPYKGNGEGGAALAW
jgi:hypothetical protein